MFGQRARFLYCYVIVSIPMCILWCTEFISKKPYHLEIDIDFIVDVSECSCVVYNYGSIFVLSLLASMHGSFGTQWPLT